MAFDQSTRNRLSRFVTDARALLTEECTRQLQRTYGIDPASGELTDVERLSGISDAERQTAGLLRETAEHYQPGFARLAPRARREIIERIVREQAFTVLNRLCALRMAEARGLLIESIAASYQSRGFQLYARLAGSALGETGDAYRCYLFSLFDEFAVDLAVLFDRFSPAGRLFPGETALLRLLDLVNHAEIEALWTEDETIGWIYQYFNSKEERKAMRDASAAPRNSRELAVRNQFFTPRYVVEFLTDNTLGRIWYEMTQGQTGLVDSCRYLVRRPTEVFLAPGEQGPADDRRPTTDDRLALSNARVDADSGQQTTDDGLSQEELLRQPVYIPHRPLKDPRAITMLDPACGSMHFGLYAFDLFERIYDEAWDLEDERGPQALERAPMDAPLHEAYPDKASFLRDVPRLIVERNIHGVDIDPRAVQIAGLSLWLRAQKSWREQGVKPQERPQIRRSNVVCAEPMPGDEDLLEEFIARQLSGNAEDAVVAWMLRQVFDAMALAGEAGSLLKIEEDVTAIVAEAKQRWQQGPTLAQSSFLAGEAEHTTQRALALDASGITDASFWARAEERIYAALRDYAAQAENGAGYRRRLFADDAARGFAFIDLSRRRYDVVLMNPPFGEATLRTNEKINSKFASAKNDLFAVFVAAGITYLSLGGRLGAITNRTGFFNTYLESWREDIFYRIGRLDLLLDLGSGVLDALVETAAYIITEDRSQSRATVDCIRLVGASNKEDALEAVYRVEGKADRYIIRLDDLSALPNKAFVYWLPGEFLRKLKSFPSVASAFVCTKGLSTDDDYRFVRLWWEIPSESIGLGHSWVWFAKGGEYSTFFYDVHLLVLWRNNGKEMAENAEMRDANVARTRQSLNYYFKPASSFSNRTTLPLSARILPGGCIFSHKTVICTPINGSRSSILTITALLNSGFGSLFTSAVTTAADTAARSYESGTISQMPLSQVLLDVEQIHELVMNAWYTVTENRTVDEACILNRSIESEKNSDHIEDYRNILLSIDKCINQGYELKANLPNVHLEIGNDFLSTEAPIAIVRRRLSNGVGNVLGRWDIRYATGDRSAPELPGPFAPLPVCPPGMLQNAQGLPATSDEDIVSSESDVAPTSDPRSPTPGRYPLRISWPGILVDDEGHPEDIEGRVREAIQVIWGQRAEAIEQEACEILGVRSLREYFRKPALFFADHLSRYSKSRRQAPIYWPLSTPSGSYTLWLYYHRLTDQTLYSCVNDFVEPKLSVVSGQLSMLRRKSGRTPKEEKDLERLSDLEQELQDFRAELLRVAAFWKPNLNDGVQISAAPLWRLFQHKPWQKRLRETWEKLEQGEYDWAHLAYSIWPERVREKCKSDKSLAIAHDLEGLYVAPPTRAKKKGRGKKVVEVEDGEMFGEE
jgi:hypothetical protein